LAALKPIKMKNASYYNLKNVKQNYFPCFKLKFLLALA